jgi:hypothetical protein
VEFGREKRGRSNRSGRRLNILENSRFREAQNVGARDDQMIEHTNIDQGQSAHQASRNRLIGRTGFGDLARMVVNDHNRSGVAGERELYDFARVNACPIDRAPKEFHELDQSVPRIQ